MGSPVVVVIVLLAVGAIAWLMRGRGVVPDELAEPGKRPTDDGPSYAEVVEESDADTDDEDEDPEHIAVSSDGLAFVPQPHGVRIAPEKSFRAKRPAGDAAAGFGAAAEDDVRSPHLLSAGDLIATRVVRGAPDLDPWRLETLGRDRDMQVWSFETPEAAEAARGMLERRVVRVPLDPDGDPLVIGPDDFEAAERELERTLHELTTMTDEDAAEERDR